MKVYLHSNPNMAHQVEAMRSMWLGMLRHGFQVTGELDDADVSVWWDDRAPPKAKDRPRLILGAGYINGQSGDYVRDRLRFVSANWNGQHGCSSPAPSDCPPDRWDALGVDMQKWRITGRQRHALLLAQVPGDRCAPGADTWKNICALADARWERVTVRSHPLVDREIPLLEQLIDVDVAVTWASTAAVECVVAGVPTITLERSSIAWEVTSHRLDTVIALPDRAQWAYNLAYRQWSHRELESGEAWEYLHYGIDHRHSTGCRTGIVGGSQVTHSADA